MKYLKKINNNVALVEDESSREWLVVGRGLGFGYTAGDELTEEQIDRRFLAEPSKDFSYIIDTIFTIDEKLIEAINEMILDAEAYLNIKFLDNNYLTLVDHIRYAFIRSEKKEELTTLMSWEAQKLYPKEYQAALLSVQLLEKRMEKKLPANEAIFITMHYINANSDQTVQDDTQNINRIIQSILTFINLELGNVEVDTKSTNYARLVTHLRYFVIRQVKQEKLVDSSFDEELEGLIQKKYERAYHIALGIAEKLRREEGWDISMNETLYLTLHIRRVFMQDQ